MTLTPRARAQAIAARRGGRHTLAVPLALRLAARIQERPLEDFFTDPTQLANGLTDFLGAVGPDGLVVTDPDVLSEEITASPVAALPSGRRTATALEATRRLKATVGESAILVALLPGPVSAGADAVATLVKAFLGAGIDVLVFCEHEDADLSEFEAPLRTTANMARFHRALTYLSGPKLAFLETPVRSALAEPLPSDGLVLTDCDLPTDTDITAVQDWITAVRL